MKKNAKPCRWYLLDLPGYLTGELAPHEARLVDRHLEDCPQCSNDLERFRSLDSLLIESLESPRSTLEFQAAFFKRLGREAASEQCSTGRLRYGRMCRRAIIPMAAAASAVLAVVIFRSPHPATETTVTEPVAARPAAVEPPLAVVAEHPMAAVAAVSAPVETASGAIAQNERVIDYSVVREVEPEQAPLAMGETGGSG